MKIDTNLDAKVSTRSTLTEIEASTILAMKVDVQDVETKVDDLGSPMQTGDDIVDAIKTKVDTLENYDPTTVLAAIDDTLKAVDYVAPDNSSVAEIKDKVNSLENYDDATAQSKLDAIKSKTDTLVNTDLTGIATATNVTNAKDEIIAEIEAIPVVDVEGMKADLEIINNNVKKASKIIPAKQNLTT